VTIVISDSSWLMDGEKFLMRVSEKKNEFEQKFASVYVMYDGVYHQAAATTLPMRTSCERWRKFLFALQQRMPIIRKRWG